MKKICLTGGIACGKSLLSRFLNELGVETLDADDIVHGLIPAEERRRLAKVVFKVSTVKDGKFNYNGGMDIALPAGAPNRVVAVIDDGKALVLGDGKECVGTVDKEITDGANVR